MSRTTTVATAFLALLALGHAAPVPKTRPGPIYFPTTVGAKWVYSEDGHDRTEVVTAIEKDGGAFVVTVEAETDGRRGPAGKFRVSEDALFKLESAGILLVPPVCLLRLPVRDGESWDIGHAASRDETVGTATSHAPEHIEVSAGGFPAHRVTADYRRNGTECWTTTWYAVGVGEVRSESESGGRKLTSFTPGKP
jgi:hypothetical protein